MNSKIKYIDKLIFIFRDKVNLNYVLLIFVNSYFSPVNINLILKHIEIYLLPYN